MSQAGALSAERLCAMLAALPIGLGLYAADGRLELMSETTLRWHGLDPALAPPGTPFADVVRILAWTGAYGRGDPAAIARGVLAADRTRATSRQLRTSSGRHLQLENRPLPGGGFVSCAIDITPYSRGEAEAEARARMLDLVLTRLRAGVALFDAEFRVSLANPALDALLGLPGGSIRPGMSRFDIIRRMQDEGELSEEEAEAMAAQVRAERHLSTSRQRQRASGEVLRLDSQPLPDGGCLIEVDDVTALKLAEDEASRRAALLDGVLEALPHGVLVYGPDRRVSLFNAAYNRIMADAEVTRGDALQEVVARRVASGELDAERAELVMRRQYRHDPTASGPLRRVRPNGTAIETRVARLPDGGHISVVTDVTALHRAEAEARQRAAMLEAMLASIRQGMIMYGPDHRVMATNAQTSRLTGMAPGLLVPGTTLHDLLDGQVARGEFTAAAAAALKALDRRLPHRYTRTRADGTVLDIASDPMPDGGFVITYSDVSEDRRVAAELERARAAAEAASEAKSRFLATMGHELRTPLNAVIGFSEALAAERDGQRDAGQRDAGQRDDDRIGDFARAINESGRHLLLLIDDILDVARSQTGALSIAEAPVALEPLLHGAVRAVAAAAEQAGLTVAVDLPAALPALLGDARRLHQVLLNLLSNAVKFTPGGGVVTLSAAADGAGLAIRVADTGIGIAPEDRERVFEPFTQVDNSLARRFQGSGLGLYLARTLAQALGGTVALEGSEGQGTVAVLRFPASRLLAADPPSA